MPAPHPITVLIARFDDLVARGLHAYLSEDPALSVVARDVPAARLEATLAKTAPRVAILDFAALRSPADVHRIRAAHPRTHMLVLADRPSALQAGQMLAFGATACLAKRTPAGEVLDAIRLAASGMPVPPRAIPVEGDGPQLLTHREAAVLELLQDGGSNVQIAAALRVGVETVRTHRRNLYRKLGVRNRRELSALCARIPA